MNRKTGKRTAAFLATALAATVFAGCSSGGNDNGAGSSNAPVAPTQQAKEVKKMTSVSYWTEMHADAAAVMKTYNEITAYKELEERTGVKIEFQHPMQGQSTEQFNLMMSSGKLPDVVEYAWSNYPGGANKAIKDRKIVPLNDYMEHAPNLQKLLDENPEWKKQVSTDEGDIIGFPFIRPDSQLQTFRGLVLRKDWLDKVGMEAPETIDEWYTVLKAFKEEDPNGNGVADEIPINIGAGDISLIGAYGIVNGFYNDNNTVKFGPIQPQFKDYLAQMNKWFKEGLLDKDFAATDAKLFDAKMTNDQLGAAALTTGAGLGRFVALMETTNPEFMLAPAPYPTLVKGAVPELGQRDNSVTGLFAAITSDNKNIEETVEWLDYKYSEEGRLLMNFGKEGYSYTMVNGVPTFTDLVMKNPDGLPLAQSMKLHVMSAIAGPFVQDLGYLMQFNTLPEQHAALEVWTKPTNEKLMPPVSVTSEESGKLASIMNDVNTYNSEMTIKFIMGAVSLDEFDSFVSTLKSMGIDDAVAIQQSALNRYLER